MVGALGQAKAALNQIVLDPERGYASLHGADAMAGREKALSEFDKSLREESTLPPKRQKENARLLPVLQ